MLAQLKKNKKKRKGKKKMGDLLSRCDFEKDSPNRKSLKTN